MRIGSLCTGYGGLDRAVHEVLGGELAWVADIDEGACKILAHRFPGVPNLGDITITDWTTVRPVDVLAGGYPCQPFSDAGNRKGTDDERHIWPYFATAIRVLRPRLVVLENVRGHLGRGFDTVLADLAALGFDAEWVTVPASGVGACHQRQRVFILAWPAANAERDGLERCGTAARAGTGRTPAASVGCRSSDSGPVAEDAYRATGDQRRLAAAGQAPGGRSRADAGRPARARLAAVSGTAPEWATDEFWTRPGAFKRYEAAVRRHESVLGRRTPAPVEPGRTGNPRLAARFPEWMMGLPDGWVTGVPGLSRNDQLHAIGNGVMPQQGAAALRLLLDRSGLLPLVAADLPQSEGGEAA